MSTGEVGEGGGGESTSQRIDSHDSDSVPTPDSPIVTTTELPAEEEEPEQGSTKKEVVTSSRDSNNNNNDNSSSPTTTSRSQPPSRRVKVYKLKDDAWVDLGTGTCRGVLNHDQSPPGDMEQDREEEQGRSKDKIDPDQEGAWIVVKREKPPKKSPQSEENNNNEDDNDNDNDNDDEDEDDERNIILKTRVQPYPPGYSEDFDEEELLENEDGSASQTLDVGGYQRQQDTLIVWTEHRSEGGEEEELEMALSFATSTGCAEMWEFIKAARRFTAEQANLNNSFPSSSGGGRSSSTSPSPSPSLSSPGHSFSSSIHSNFNPSSSSSSQLPIPTLGSVPQLETSIRQLSRTTISRERLALQIVKTKFVENLIKVHEQAEDLESLQDLHALCRVMQTILLLNDNSIFELVLKDELILGVAGILEYDPDFPSMKACYKTHLSSSSESNSTFIELIPIKNQSLLNKIHQTHRLHYLKDVILARILEDSTHSMLNSAIYFNEVEIVNEVVGNGNGNGNGDPGIVEQVFKILTGEEEEEDFKGKGKEKEKESGPNNDQLRPRLLKQPEDDDDEISLRKARSIQFLTQLTQMAKNLQLPLRTSFYRQLVEKGLLKALESALRFANDQRDLSLRAMVIAMWMSVVDLDAKDVRAYCLKQGKEKEKQQEEEQQQQEDDDDSRKKEKLFLLEDTMLGGLIETLKNEQDLGIKTHLAEALRVLLDAAGDSGPLEAPPRLRLPEDPEAEKFLQYFYDHYILSLLEPLLSLTSTSTSTTVVVTPSLTALLSHLCDLLCFFVAHHSFRSKYLILSSPQLAKSVSILLHPPPPPPPQVNSDNTSSSRLFSRQTHLRLASLRFFRSCIAKNDDFYNRFLIKHDLLKSVVETVLEEKDKDNLLGSACLEFFEYIRATNTKSLINHLMDRCGEQIRKLCQLGFKTFQGLISRWEINNEPPPPPPAPPTQSQSTAASNENGGGGGGGGGALSGAMERQTSKPGWSTPNPPTPLSNSANSSSSSSSSARMDLEEEDRYFNSLDDDDDDEDGEFISDSSATTTNKNDPTISSHFASSRRKREPTSNPSLDINCDSNDGKGVEIKRFKLDGGDQDEVVGEQKENKETTTSLPKSQTRQDGASRGGLVDYMDEDDNDEENIVPLAGGFIRESSSSDKIENETLPTTTQSTETSLPLPLPLPGVLKRKQEEEEESEGLGGLLLGSNKNLKKESSPTTKPSKAKNASSLTSPSSTTKTPTAKPTASNPSSKPGGFKIAFGSSLAKANVAAPSTTLTTATATDTKKEEKLEEEVKDKTSRGGFGKFGGGTTEPSSPNKEKG